MKSALFFCLVVFNCCPKENVTLCVVITPSSLSVLMKRSFVLIWSSSPSLTPAGPQLKTSHAPPSPVWFCIHSFCCPSDSSQNFTFSFDLLDEGFRRNAANIEIPLPYHVVNNEETCLHLLCFRLTELKTSMICPPARRPEFGLWLKLIHLSRKGWLMFVWGMIPSRTKCTLTTAAVSFSFICIFLQTSMLLLLGCSSTVVGDTAVKILKREEKSPVKDVYSYFSIQVLHLKASVL